MMRRWPVALVLSALIVTGAGARDTAPVRDAHWIATWGSAQMIAEGDNALPADRASAITLRQVVRVSAGGEHVRIRLSNAFGTRPLAIGGAHLGRPIAPGTPRIEGGARLTFSGRSDAVIPAGAEIYSDPVAFPVAAGADLAISLYLPDAASPQTGHPGSRATSFTLAGNAVADATLAGATPTTHWYAITDVEVAAAPTAGTIVAIGDSITDGYGVKPERNTRWTDVLAQRLRGSTATRAIGVVNAGIGGNRVLLDGLGPNMVARFDRDVVARSGVRWAIVLEGVNDLGVLTREAPATPAKHAALVAQVTAGFAQIVARAHAHGIKVIGGTVMPFGGNTYYHPTAENEADRQAVNSFIRSSGVFDAVIDFDKVMRDPAHPDRLSPAYDSGDHLHPSEAGYKAMGEAVPLNLFGGPRTPARSRSVIGVAAPVPVGPGGDKGPAIAITFDDIPAHGPLVPGQTRVDVIRAITGALAAAKAPACGVRARCAGRCCEGDRRLARRWTAARQSHLFSCQSRYGGRGSVCGRCRAERGAARRRGEGDRLALVSVSVPLGGQFASGSRRGACQPSGSGVPGRGGDDELQRFQLEPGLCRLLGQAGWRGDRQAGG
jgi:lysophospholipase L1-like esterase